MNWLSQLVGHHADVHVKEIEISGPNRFDTFTRTRGGSRAVIIHSIGGVHETSIGLEKAYEAISCLRIMLSTHPLAKDVEIPEYLQQEKGIAFISQA